MKDEKDELYNEALNIVNETKKYSVSLLQRRLNVGYCRGARLIEMIKEGESKENEK